MSSATLQPPCGCTLAAYSATKKLPLEFLQGSGLREINYHGTPAIAIPYHDAEGVVGALRYRVALSRDAGGDDRFRWKRGTRPCLYGLDRLHEAHRYGFVVLVEGESDAQTLWFHGIPALGIPGASTWKDSWADHLAGIERILVVVEPDAGGRALVARLSKSSLRDRLFLVRLDGAKDPSELHVADPSAFRQKWEAAVAQTRPWREEETAATAAQTRRAAADCAELAAALDILRCFFDELTRSGVVGEERAAKLLFLTVMSRFQPRPVSAAVKGPSAAGKSYLVERVLQFFPPEAYYALTGMSDHSLVYSQEPLVHRFLVIYEAVGLQGDFATYAIRSLLSEGRLRYETVDKTRDGMQPRLIEREGPTGLLVTTTKIQLHPENETRLLSIPVTDSPEQTKAVMRATAGESRPPTDFTPWHALQDWLAGAERRVVVPFGRGLADLIEPVAVRLRRDFSHILTLIRSHAMLHQASRERDAEGRIVATVEDYRVVRELVADLVAEGAQAAVPPTVRATVEAVEALAQASACPVTVAEVARHLRLDKSAALRRVRAAIEPGYLRNLEDHRGRPARLELGEPMPGDPTLLPTVEAVAKLEGCTVAPQLEGVDLLLSPDEGSRDQGSVERDLPDGSRPPPPEACPFCGSVDFHVSVFGPVICRSCRQVVAGNLEEGIQEAHRVVGPLPPGHGTLTAGGPNG